MSKIDVVFDPTTFGLALYWTGPVSAEKAPDFLKVNAITCIIGPIVIGATFAGESD